MRTMTISREQGGNYVIADFEDFSVLELEDISTIINRIAFSYEHNAKKELELFKIPMNERKNNVI